MKFYHMHSIKRKIVVSEDILHENTTIFEQTWTALKTVKVISTRSISHTLAYFKENSVNFLSICIEL